LNPLVPNAYELIVFYIVPVLFAVALVFVILFVARARKSESFEFISEDEADIKDE